MKIAVIGLWHLGTVVSASLAKLGHDVVGLDFDPKRIVDLKKNSMPVQEPGLAEMAAQLQKSGKLSFTNKAADIKNCEVIVFTYDTPVSEIDEPDTKPLFDSIKKIAPHISNNILFVVMSQVPVGTTLAMAEALKSGNKKAVITPIYSPENLQLGKALECFLNPDRVVIGANTEEARKRFEKMIEKIPGERTVMDIASAEMSKHALNAFLATSLSFTYNISDLCEASGADVTKVMEALRSDKRIGRAAYLDTSLGFSGGTLMRDLRSLSGMAKKLKMPLRVIDGVIETNVKRRAMLVKKLKQDLGSLKNKNIAILGVTYKPGTSTLRRSLSAELISLLKKEGVKISAYDPGADAQEFFKVIKIKLSKNPYEAAREASALICVTPWPEFLELDLPKLSSVMKSPKIFFDTRSFFKQKEQEIVKNGFAYRNIGKGLLKESKLL